MSELFGPTVRFYKVQGCGNDFVAVDNRQARVPVADMAEWARRVCRRAFGVGADGIFFLEEAPAGSGADYVWHFYNSDGSRAEMCGNASRCAARLAHGLGLAGVEHVFGADAGLIHAKVLPELGQAKVQLTRPKNLELNIPLTALGRDLAVHFVNTGVPHAVVLFEEVAAVDVKGLGRALRFHEHFAPAGTNVNFVQVKDAGNALLRTYERGVEDETYACGTGAAAAQVVLSALGLTGGTAAFVTTGGETLTVSLEEGFAHLQGGAELVFTGDLNLASLGLPLS